MKEQWILGYLSGIAISGNFGDILDGTSSEAIFKAIDAKCKLRPGQTTSQAAKALAKELQN